MITFLLVIWGHLILDVPDKRDPHLRNVVTSKDVTYEMCLDGHLDLHIYERLLLRIQ